MPALLIKASFFGFYEMARAFKAKINYYLNSPFSAKEVAGLKKKSWNIPRKMSERGPNLPHSAES